MRLYVICKAIKWTHLPNAGGLYDQDPRLLDDWYVIMEIEAQETERRRKEQERQQRSKGRTMGAGRRRGRR